MNTNTCGFSWASIWSIIYHLSGHPGKSFGIGLAQMHMIWWLCVLCDYFIRWICGPVEMLCSKGAVLFSLVCIIVYDSMTSNVVHV